MHSVLVESIVGLLPFVFCVAYTGAFKYRTKLMQPAAYENVLNGLRLLTWLFLVATVAMLVIQTKWKVALVISTVCGGSQWLVSLFTYRRAVNEVVDRLGTIPAERRVEMAMKIVEMDVESGKRR